MRFVREKPIPFVRRLACVSTAAVACRRRTHRGPSGQWRRDATNTTGVPFAAAISAVLLAACSKKPTNLTEPPRPVIFQEVSEVHGTETRTFTGVLKASGLATLGFEVPGRITQMLAVEGRRYEKGAVLAQLDVANFQADLSRAEAEALQANEELKRTDQLYATNNASKAQLDAAIATQRAAAAALQVAQKKVADGTLTMPYDGVIEELINDVQSVVAQGTPVLAIQGEGAMRLDIGVPAEVIAQVQVGMAASVTIQTVSIKGVPATVRKISPQASPNGTYLVNLDLTETPPEIRGGMDAEARMAFSNPRGNVMLVEAAAVVSGVEDKPYVWTLTSTSSTNGKVAKTPVSLGELRAGGQMEILDGLEAGQRVVTRGVHRLKHGQTVKLPE